MKSIFHNNFSKYFPTLRVFHWILLITQNILFRNVTASRLVGAIWHSLMFWSLVCLGDRFLKVVFFSNFLNSKNKRLKMRKPTKWYCYWKIYKQLHNLWGFPSTDKKAMPVRDWKCSKSNRWKTSVLLSEKRLVILTIAFQYYIFTLQKLFLIHKTVGWQKAALPASLKWTTENRSEEERFRE